MPRMTFSGGMPETECGLGSTLAYTEGLREELPKLLSYLGVRSILDAPCGDFNWMARTDLSGIEYHGCDFDESHCFAAFERKSEPPEFKPRMKLIAPMDLTVDSLPEVDLVLCRDFLQHLPNRAIHRVLSNFARTGAEWFLMTSHEGFDDPDITFPGGFHRVDLTRMPFGLPEPGTRIADGPGRVLGLWSREQLAARP